MQTNEVRFFMNNICDLIMNHLDQIEATRFDVTLKDDHTPVTTSDIFVEELVKKYIEEQLPGTTFIGEESFTSTTLQSEGYLVVLDPIDGTENFSSGLKEWGVSFGLWKDHKHLGSFLFLPELGLRLLSGDNVNYLSSRITGLSSSMSDSIIACLSEPGEYRIVGCAVYNFYNVIRGSFQRFINPKGAYIWDLLPGLMLALEHGCEVLVDGEKFNGTFLDPSQKYRVDIRR